MLQFWWAIPILVGHVPYKWHKKIHYLMSSTFVQVGQKRGSMARRLLNIENGFNFHFLLKSHHHQVFTNGQFLVFLFCYNLFIKNQNVEIHLSETFRIVQEFVLVNTIWTFLFVENSKIYFQKNQNVSIKKDFISMRFDPKILIKTISYAYKCVCKEGLFAQTRRT